MKLTDHLFRGKHNAVSRLELSDMLGLDERVVRRMVNRLRLQGIPIVSGQQGFWISDDPAELESFARSMQHRAREIMRVAEAILRVADRLRGQERLEGW